MLTHFKLTGSGGPGKPLLGFFGRSRTSSESETRSDLLQGNADDGDDFGATGLSGDQADASAIAGDLGACGPGDRFDPETDALGGLLNWGYRDSRLPT